MSNVKGYSVTYGHTLAFEEVSLLGLENVTKQHGPDYLYTEKTFHFRGLLTPSIASDPGIFKKTWWESDLIEKDDAFQPRQTFTYYTSTAPIIQVYGVDPTGGADFVGLQDLDWGPHFLYLNVHRVVGNKTAWCDFGIKCSVRDENTFTGSAILSNRWTTAVDSNNRYWSSRRVVGQCVFRPDALANISSDTVWTDLQNNFLLPVPNGCKREGVTTTVSEDGLVVAYSIVDTQVPFVAVPDYVADVAININVSSQQSSMDQLTMGLVDLGASLIAAAGSGVAWSASSGGPPNKSSMLSGLGQFASATGGIARQALDLATSARPTLLAQISVTVYGTPNALMNRLQSFAFAVIGARLKDVPGLGKNAPRDASLVATNVTGDSRQRIVGVTAAVSRNNVGSTIEEWLEDGLSFGIGQAPRANPQNTSQTAFSYFNALNSSKFDSLDKHLTGVFNDSTGRDQTSVVQKPDIGILVGGTPQSMVVSALSVPGSPPSGSPKKLFMS